MSLLILFIIAVCLLFYAVKVSRRNKEESEKQKTAEQPAYFDLLDDNGDTINSSDDLVRLSEATHIRVSVGSPDGENAPIQELQYFCIKDKGYHVSVWPKDKGFQGIDYIEFNIAGITHGENVEEHLGEFASTLEPEPTNEYDPNAIKILTNNGDRIGYVPKDWTYEVRKFTSLPCTCYCYIGQHDGTYFTDCYISTDNP